MQVRYYWIVGAVTLLFVSMTASGCILGVTPSKTGADSGSGGGDTDQISSPDVRDAGDDVDRDGTDMPSDTGDSSDGSDGSDAQRGPKGFSVKGGLAPSGGRSTGGSNGGEFEVRGRFLKQGDGHRARDQESSSGFSVELHPLFMRP